MSNDKIIFLDKEFSKLSVVEKGIRAVSLAQNDSLLRYNLKARRHCCPFLSNLFNFNGFFLSQGKTTYYK